jgi:VanZ family protein
MAAIFVVSGLQQLPTPPVLSFSGGHVVAYAGLAVLVVRALAGGMPPHVTRPIAVRALVITIAYGISDEFHQSFVPGRTSDVLDVIADAAGAFLGVGACWAWDILGRPSDV